ncbi:MAG: hypothetical protein ACE5GW_05650 [Planctomycetota bacterium]
MNRLLFRPALLLGVIVLIGPTGVTRAQNPDYVLSLSSTSVPPGSDAVIAATMTNTGGGVQGFSLGVCSDGFLVLPMAIDFGTALQALNGGDGPDFFAAEIDPQGNGFFCASVVSIFNLDVLGPGPALEVIVITYQTSPAASGTTVPCFCNTIGSPPVGTVVVVGGASIIPLQDCGEIEFVSGPLFIRGDANDSGAIDIADGIFILSYLFLGMPAGCREALDGNSDLTVNIADALFVLFFVNGLGPPPGAPFPGCGVASAGGSLGCDLFTSCP